jgi:hypothetical protein
MLSYFPTSAKEISRPLDVARIVYPKVTIMIVSFKNGGPWVRSMAQIEIFSFFFFFGGVEG